MESAWAFIAPRGFESHPLRWIDRREAPPPRSTLIRMRNRALRAALAAAIGLACLAGLALPGSAAAHPLGQFSVNHVTYAKVSTDRIELVYILDQAEVPTFREKDLTDQQVIDAKVEEVERNLAVFVNGERIEPRVAVPPGLSYGDGQGGLPITRFELTLEAAIPEPSEVRIEDGTFPDTPGLVGFGGAPGEGTAVQAGEGASDPTNGLTDYEGIDAANAPVNRDITLTVEPGDGTVTGPDGETIALEDPRSGEAADREGGGFEGLFEDAASGEGVFLLLLLASLGWGALHALEPGHGKAMVAAYLVGTKGTPRDAVALGGIVTITHTIGVFALGLVALALAQWVAPEDLYPWLSLAAGLLVVAVGIGLLRSRWRAARAGGAAHDHSHDHEHGDPHSHGFGHTHSHPHVAETEPTRRGLLGMGASAGLIPCPAALVVLLAAIAQHQLGLGMLLIAAFSLGLALTLTGIGLGVVYAKRAGAKVGGERLRTSRIVAALPLASNVVILAFGVALTVKAIPELS